LSEHKNVFTYEGEHLTVTWDRRLCVHVGECNRARGELFVRGRDPWCEPDGGGVAEVVERCPTGALAHASPDGTSNETPADGNTVLVSNNGPLYARGELEIEGAADDMPGVRFRAALCRCGRSANKPFCDGSHEAGGFVDRGAVGETGEALEAVGGPLAVKPVPNGPLLVTGNLTILSGHGLPTWHGTRTALCRCGHSANKPFCDGSHSREGFVSD
jgi:CDGSH-type Zn-finger protein/uncharacterized Fe-S cluster protein YjdI